MNYIKKFARSESASGIVLAIAALLAMLVANSPLYNLYTSFFDAPVAIIIGPLEIAKPALMWINDGLMVVFFFLVGLELKKEMLVGELSEVRKIILPALAAVGGMLLPALVYYLINMDNAEYLKGWAIPAATDIAFALGILSLLSKRIPTSLKVFLVSVAIFDDIGAILIIAIFYSHGFSMTAFGIALVVLVLLFILNRMKITSFTPYYLLGIILWVAVLKSGIHATIAGVLLAFFIPLRNPNDPDHSPLEEIEHDIQGSVNFMILPVFAFANSGIRLIGSGVDDLLHPVPVGIAAGLVFGKQIGIMLFSYIGIKLGLAHMPRGISWKHIYGASILCGVGFTMSLFIGGLAFGHHVNSDFDPRLGIILGSLVSGILGYVYLRMITKPSASPKPPSTTSG